MSEQTNEGLAKLGEVMASAGCLLLMLPVAAVSILLGIWILSLLF